MAKPEKSHLTLYIVIAIAVAVALALLAPHQAMKFKIGGDIFLNLLKMMVVPLVMASVMSGIIGLGDVRKLGRPGGTAIAYYLATTLLAVAVGLVVVNVIRPGVGKIDAETLEQLAAEGISVGCGNGNYCPDSAVTRDQMAVFLVRTFSLPVVLKSVTVNLSSGTGYDFSTGTSGSVTHGDFYFLNQAGVSRFWANNLGMQGLVDLGVTVGSLQNIDIPADGYNAFGVEAIIGLSYVSRAATSEPDHYILFRVTAATATDATLDWLYVSSQ